MKIKNLIFLILIILVVYGSAQEDNKQFLQSICKMSLNTQQWKQEEILAIENMNEAKKTFKTQSQLLLYNYFRFAYNYKQQLLQFIESVKPEIQEYSFLFKWLAIILSCFYLYWLIRFIDKKTGYQSSVSSFSFKNIQKILFYLIITSITIAIIFSLKGFKEGQKIEKSLGNLFCRIYEDPKGVIRGKSGVEGNGLNTYVTQIQKYESKFSKNFESIQNIFSKQYVIKQMIEIGKQMMNLQQLKSEQQQKFNKFKSQMNQTINSFLKLDSNFVKIKKSLKWFNKTLQYSRQLVLMTEVGLRALKNYTNNHITIPFIIKIISNITRIFFLLLVILCGFILYQTYMVKNNSKKINYSLLQYLLTIPIFICLIISYANSYVVPGFLWSNSVIDYIFDSKIRLKDSFSLPQKVRADLVELLSHLLPPNGDFTQMYHGHLFKNITQFGETIENFYDVDDDYFNNLYHKGIQFTVKPNEISIRQLQYLQNKNLMKEILLNFKNSKFGISQILSTLNKETGQLGIIDPSAIGRFLKNIHQVLRVPIFNRIYNTRKNCGIIGCLLFLAFVCLTIDHYIQKNSSPCGQNKGQQKLKKVNYIKLFTNDNLD